MQKTKLTTCYDNFSKTFSNSRKNMKWEEIDYFLEKYVFLDKDKKNIADIGCWNARLLNYLLDFFAESNINYIWTDLSEKMIKEAKSNFLKEKFLVLDMLDLDKLALWEENRKFDYMFFIASFHHLDSLEKREEVLKKTKNLLNKDWVIFMTNWALESELNKQKYHKSKLKNTKNHFWSSDFSIKIGDFNRFYHSFNLSELDYLFQKTWFKILENRVFENGKNIVSVIQP